MNEDLPDSQFLGIPGTLWRTADIFTAQIILARTIGLVISAQSLATKLVVDFAYPLIIIAWSLVAKQSAIISHPTLSTCSAVLGAILITALLCKVVFENGHHTMPKLPGKVFLFFTLGFVFFPLPEFFILYGMSVCHGGTLNCSDV
jgi:hypothetical protein